jgi:hypothetical protein
MSKHTPGPWVIDDSNPNLVARLVNGVYEYVCAVEPSSFSNRECNQEQEEADARLIAAAPDLLEALKMAMLDWENMRVVPPASRPHKAARAAIAKAEGKV